MSVFEVIGPIFRAVTNATGTTCFNADYYPFGQEIDHDTSCTPTYKFTGYEFDSETGNYYAYARYYNSRLGRFMSPDPLGGDMLNPQSLNRYTYVLNNPESLVDPMGLKNIFSEFFSWLFGGDGEPPIGCEGFACNGEYGGPVGGPAQPPPGQGGGGGGGSALAKLLGPEPQPAPPPGYENCITAALESLVADAEGTATAPGGGYGLVVYGTVASAPAQFAGLVGTTGTRSNPITIDPETLSGNPGIFVDVGAVQSTAFGRYQINAPTAAWLGMTNFEPSTQDAAAATLLNRTGAVAAMMGGNFQQAMADAGRTWASLPGAPYGQPTISMAQAQADFQTALNTVPQCQQ